MMKPMDIHNKEFKKVMRGYDQEEVDEFLDEVIIDYEQMQRELEILHEQVNTYSDNMTMYREREDALNNVLLSAQQFADTIRKDAEFSAKKILEDAQTQADNILGATQGKLEMLEAKYEALLARYETIRNQVCDYLKAQIAMVEGAELSELDAETVQETPEKAINEKIKELMDEKNL